MRILDSKKLEEKVKEARWCPMLAEISPSYFHKDDTTVMIGPAGTALADILREEGKETIMRRAHKLFVEGEKIYD